MAQASLTRGVGTWVADTEALVLLNGSDVDATGTGGPAPGDDTWQEIFHPGVVQVEAVTGTCTGSSVVCDVSILAADNVDGDNPVVLGKFETITEASDDETRRIVVEILNKPFLQASYVVSGSTPVVPLTVKVRDKDYHQSPERTA